MCVRRISAISTGSILPGSRKLDSNVAASASTRSCPVTGRRSRGDVTCRRRTARRAGRCRGRAGTVGDLRRVRHLAWTSTSSSTGMVEDGRLLADEYGGDLGAADDVPDRGHAIQHRRIPPRDAETQRGGRALPADRRSRMGLRAALPRLKRPRPSLTIWLDQYNYYRNHSSLSNRSPIGRLVRTTRDTTARRSFGGQFVLWRPVRQPSRSGASEPLPLRRPRGTVDVDSASGGGRSKAAVSRPAPITGPPVCGCQTRHSRRSPDAP